MPKKLSQELVDSSDDSSASPRPRSKKRAKVESESEPEGKSTKSKNRSNDKDKKKKPVAGKKCNKAPSEDDDEDEQSGEDSDGADGKRKNKGKGNDRGKKSKSFQVESLENDQGETYFDLGNGRRATVSEYRGNIGIDIRETYAKDGKEGLPGKKGIKLNLAQFDRLKKCLGAIEDAVDKLS
ncbi:hypothetical protein JCM3766R1_003644 [Sporobolomyces carnicolor]